MIVGYVLLSQLLSFNLLLLCQFFLPDTFAAAPSNEGGPRRPLPFPSRPACSLLIRKDGILEFTQPKHCWNLLKGEGVISLVRFCVAMFDIRFFVALPGVTAAIRMRKGPLQGWDEPSTFQSRSFFLVKGHPSPPSKMASFSTRNSFEKTGSCSDDQPGSFRFWSTALPLP